MDLNNIAGFEDGGRGTEAKKKKKKCRWFLEDGKSKETDYSLDSVSEKNVYPC